MNLSVRPTTATDQPMLKHLIDASEHFPSGMLDAMAARASMAPYATSAG